MAELLPGVHTVDGVRMDLAGAEMHIHPALIVGETGLTLIDAGPVGSEGPIRAYLESLGFGLPDIERIIITHHHADHTGALARLAQQTDAIISAHVDAVPFVEGRVPQPDAPVSPGGLQALGITVNDSGTYGLQREWQGGFTPEGVTVTDPLRGGDVLPALGGLIVLHTPGHSPGHIALFSGAWGVLFAADLFYSNGREIIAPLPVFTNDAGQALESLRAILADNDFQVAIPFHGTPLLQDASDQLRRALSASRVPGVHALSGSTVASH